MIIPDLNLQYCNTAIWQFSYPCISGTTPPPFSPAIVRDREILISAPFTCKPLQYINSEASLFLQETGWLTLPGGGWGGGRAHPFCPKIILYYSTSLPNPWNPRANVFPLQLTKLPVTVSMDTVSRGVVDFSFRNRSFPRRIEEK
jgi:hypothetical protein